MLELGRLLPGPFAGLLLSDLGAQVDKLEDPRKGDYLRGLPARAPDGMSIAFHRFNRGKRSIELDLKTKLGRGDFERLIKTYDVVIEAFRPGVMQRLGLAYSHLSQLRPGLVYCAISGYGQTGPLATRAGHDLNYLSYGGALGVGGPKGKPPQVPGTQQADLAGGLFAALAIVSALRTGEGAFLDISMAEAVMSFATFGLSTPEPRGEGSLDGGMAVYQVYETSDGRHVSIAALEPKFWNAFCEANEMQPELSDLLPGAHQAVLQARLADLFGAQPLSHWRAMSKSVDCCLSPVLSPEELFHEAHHRARGLFETVAGVVHWRTPVGRPKWQPAPRRGEHTSEALDEF